MLAFHMLLTVFIVEDPLDVKSKTFILTEDFLRDSRIVLYVSILLVSMLSQKYQIM